MSAHDLTSDAAGGPTGGFMATPVLEIATRSAPVRQSVALLAMTEIDEILSEWRALAETAPFAEPFAEPEFLIPAAAHAPNGDAPLLAAVWDEADGVRQLAGLFPVAPPQAFGNGWARARTAVLWRHPQQPWAAALVAGPEARAQRTVAALIAWLQRQPKANGFQADALTAEAARHFGEASATQGLALRRRRGPARTHGLDFRPEGGIGEGREVAIARDPAALRSGLERLFCLEAEAVGGQPALLRDPLQPALLRAVLRGFGARGRALIATIDDAGSRAGALVLEGRDRAYLWRLFGPSAGDPAVEAALALAAEANIGKPIVGAALRPLAGVGTETRMLESLDIAFRPGQLSRLERLRMWIGSGLF